MVITHVSLCPPSVQLIWGPHGIAQTLVCARECWQVSDFRMPDPSVSYSKVFLMGTCWRKVSMGMRKHRDLHSLLLPRFWHVSDCNSQNITCQRPGSWRKTGNKDTTNAIVGSYIPVEDFLQLSVAFYDHFLLKMTHMPHTKKGACILGDKGEEKAKIYSWWKLFYWLQWRSVKIPRLLG